MSVYVCACGQLPMCVGVLSTAVEVLIWSSPLLAVKILLQVFIIASVWNSGSVVCVCVLHGRWSVEGLCVWRDGGSDVGGSTGGHRGLVCFPQASPQPMAQCTLGNGEAYWSWLVPAGSQIEFWQAGETISQRDPPLPPHTPVPGTMAKAGERAF